ncbi:MAG: zinc ribbon domain-containing protein [Thermoleophilia bacterium]|nr:zinc ribbon domain-containing protein [Thermoleophilia bacterium]
MPIYEFCCRSCESRFEELVSAAIVDNGGVECPKCGSSKTERLLSAFSFTSSGGGAPASMGKSGCSACAKTSCASCG